MENNVLDTTLATPMFCFKYSENIEDTAEIMLNQSNSKANDIMNFFGISEFKRTDVLLFDTVEKYRNYLCGISKTTIDSIPKYSRGCIFKDVVLCVVEPHLQNEKDSKQYENWAARVTHEWVHILYNTLVVRARKQKRIEWFDEGIAQYLSGQKASLDNEEEFKEFFQNSINKTHKYPKLNCISHKKGNFIEENNYDGYVLSYIAVKYMFETMKPKEIRFLMENEEELLKFGDSVLEKSFSYYKKKYTKSNEEKLDSEPSL